MRGRNTEKYIVSVFAYNNPRLLMKITGLFSRRGFNIESISVGKAKEKDILRLTIIVRSEDDVMDQIQKQLYKIVETVKVSFIEAQKSIEKELALIKIKANQSKKAEFIQIIEVFKGKILDVNPSGLIVEISGKEEKIDAFINTIGMNNIVEIARSGTVAISRW